MYILYRQWSSLSTWSAISVFDLTIFVLKMYFHTRIPKKVGRGAPTINRRYLGPTMSLHSQHSQAYSQLDTFLYHKKEERLLKCPTRESNPGPHVVNATEPLKQKRDTNFFKNGNLFIHVEFCIIRSKPALDVKPDNYTFSFFRD